MLVTWHERIDDFGYYLKGSFSDEDYEAIRRSEIVGRAIRSDAFLEKLRSKLSRPLRRQRRGPRPK